MKISDLLGAVLLIAAIFLPEIRTVLFFILLLVLTLGFICKKEREKAVQADLSL